MTDPAPTVTSLSVLTFRVGALSLAVKAQTVREVARVPRLTRVPHAPAALAGVAGLRGAALPVVSAARLLDAGEAEAGTGSRVLVLNLETPVGLLVDEVADLATLEAGGAEDGRLFVRDGASVRVLDLEARLAAAFQNPLTAERRAGAQTSKSVSAAPAAAEAVRPLLGFELNGQVYAIPLGSVVEVSAPPSSVSSLPRADIADLGVTPWRDGVLPVVSVAVLLGLTPRSAPSEGRLIVVRVEGGLVGLVVDQLRAILRIPEAAIDAVPPVLNRGGGEASLVGMGRVAGETGLVALLSPQALFREDAQRFLEDRKDADDAMTDTVHEAVEKVVVFRLGGEDYALPIDAVQEVVALPDRLTRVPGAPRLVEGIMNLRGKVVPIVDQGRRFGASTGGLGRRVIVTSVNGLQVGFAVDAVSEILSLTGDQIAPASTFFSEDRQTFDRVASLNDGERLVLIVDPRALLDKVEADALRDLANTDGARP